jgi:hypothetical protein
LWRACVRIKRTHGEISFTRLGNHDFLNTEATFLARLCAYPDVKRNSNDSLEIEEGQSSS